MKPHKHAELIKAWADGAEIEVRVLNTNRGWSDWQDDPNPCWVTSGRIYYEYRIKPEPSSDFGMLFIAKRDTHGYSILPTWKGANLKLVWDGETGELKSAEVLK